MKLLFCELCGSGFTLAIKKIKTCDCGEVRGMYLNNRQAATNGKGIAIGMGTGSLHSSMISKSLMERDDEKYTRKRYQDSCSIITWSRPHSGIANPNSIVVTNKELKEYELE